MKVHITKKYMRYRLRSPSQFIRGSFRTHDFGRVGHSKRIAGRLKRNNLWATQAILITRSDYKKGLRVKKVNGRFEIYRKR